MPLFVVEEPRWVLLVRNLLLLLLFIRIIIVVVDTLEHGGSDGVSSRTDDGDGAESVTLARVPGGLHLDLANWPNCTEFLGSLHVATSAYLGQSHTFRLFAVDCLQVSIITWRHRRKR